MQWRKKNGEKNFEVWQKEAKKECRVENMAACLMMALDWGVNTQMNTK